MPSFEGMSRKKESREKAPDGGQLVGSPMVQIELAARWFHEKHPDIELDLVNIREGNSKDLKNAIMEEWEQTGNAERYRALAENEPLRRVTLADEATVRRLIEEIEGAEPPTIH